MTEPRPQFSENETDAFACADRMRPALQKIIDQCSGSVEPFLGAMITTYAGLLKERGSDGQSVLRALAAFAAMPAPLRNQVPNCHAQIKSMIGQLKHDGFALDAILWAMLGAILSLYQECRVPQDQIDKARDDMIVALNEARRPSLH
jgi:hypothetical protein